MSYTLLFDVDGTLADTLDSAILAINTLADRYHYSPLEETKSLRHLDWRKLPAHLGVSRFKSRKFWRLFRETFQAQEKKPEFFSALPDVLTILTLSDIKLAALTSASMTNFSQLANEKNNFLVANTKEYSVNKRQALQAFVEEHHLDPYQVVYVGDEIADIEAAHIVGVKSIAVGWGVNQASVLQVCDPTFMIHQPQELLTVISQL